MVDVRSLPSPDAFYLLQLTRCMRDTYTLIYAYGWKETDRYKIKQGTRQWGVTATTLVPGPGEGHGGYFLALGLDNSGGQRTPSPGLSLITPAESSLRL